MRSDKSSLIRQVLGAYGEHAIVDASVRGPAVSFDADDVTIAEASELLKLATDTFWVTRSGHDVQVFADTKENRSRYERLITSTLHIPALRAEEVKDVQNIVRDMFGTPQLISQKTQGSLIIRAPDPQTAAISEAYTELFAGSSELHLEVDVYEVSDSKSTNKGMILPNSATLFNVQSEISSIIAGNSSLVQQIISSGLASAGDYAAILAILIASGDVSGTVFNSPFVVFGGGWTQTGVEWNSTSANMLLNTSNAKSLYRTGVQVTDKQEATFRSGQRFPIMSSSYTLVSTSSSSKTTIPQIQYQDLGLTMKVRPFIEGNDRVALNMDLKLTSLAGTSLNGIPILANRQFTGLISVRADRSAVLASTMSSQDAQAITGLPGISEIPTFRSGTNRQDVMQGLTLVIIVTPHIVRIAHQEAASPMMLLPLH